MVQNQIIQQHQNCVSQYQISQKFHFAQSTVCTGIIKCFTTTRKSCPGKFPGQKLKLTNQDVHLFRQYMSKNKHLAVADLEWWTKQSFGKIISEASMRWWIKRCGYVFDKSRSKQFHTTTNKCRCVAWAKSHLTWNFSQWERILWTDETIFHVSYGNIGQKVIRKKDEANDPSCYNHVVSHPSSLIVWDGIAANGDSNLRFYRNTINA